MPSYGVLITYREVLRAEPSLTDLQNILKKYQRAEVLLMLGKINSILGNWKNQPQEKLDEDLSNYMLWKHRARLDQLRSRHRSRFVFSRLTLLFLVKQACLACPDHGSNLKSLEAANEIGLCCLMANDLVLPFIPSASDSLLEKVANLLPFVDYVSRDHYPMEIARTEMILEDILRMPELMGQKGFVELPKLFEDHFGFSARTFCQMVFGCVAKSIQVTPEILEKTPDALILRDTYFSKSRITPETAANFFQKASIPEAEFAKRIRDAASKPGDDLTLIQKYPLLEITPKAYICLDPGFLIEKAGRGFYWTLLSQLSKPVQDKLLSFWGTIFESYVNHILQKSYVGHGRFIPQPRFRNGDASFDACVVEDTDLVVFEHKCSVIRADAKYGGDVAKLEAELLLKFVHGEPKERKGTSQISNSLVRFLGGENLGDIDSRTIRRIYPVIVGLENTITMPYMVQYLRQQFKNQFPRKRFPQVVTSLFTLSVEDVENLLGYLPAFAFPDILESYNSADRHAMASISLSGLSLLRNASPAQNLVTERFSEFGVRIERDLFGAGEEATAPPAPQT